MCIHNILRFIYTIINLFPFHSWSCLHKKNTTSEEKYALRWKKRSSMKTLSPRHPVAIITVQYIMYSLACLQLSPFSHNTHVWNLIWIYHIHAKLNRKKSILMLLRWRWRWRWCKGNKIKWCKSNFREIKSENIFPSVQFTCPFRCRHFFFFFRFFFCSHSFGCIFLVSLTLPLLILLSFALFSPSLFFG